MKQSEIKTIDVTTLTWVDRTYGNTYFAQQITINYCMPDQMQIKNPFQYGYSSYEFEAIKRIKEVLPDFLLREHELRDNGIILRHTKHENCKQRELKNQFLFCPVLELILCHYSRHNPDQFFLRHLSDVSIN